MAMKKYELAAAWMERKMEEEGMKAGDRMPGEMEMAKTLGFSRQTIRQAVGVLERRGILTSRQGSGIYVTGAGAEGIMAGTFSDAAGGSVDGKAAVTGSAEGHIAYDNAGSSAYDAMGRAASDSAGNVPGDTACLPSPGKRYGNVTIISTYLDDYIFPGTVRGMQGVLSEHGYTARIELTNNSVMTERGILQHLLETQETDGIIVEAVRSALPNPNLDYYRQLRGKGVRIVFFNSAYPGLDFPCVRIDDVQAASDAVRLLLQAGRERIAGIFKSDDGQGHLRYQGYLQALMSAGAQIDEERILWFSSEAYRDFDATEDAIFGMLQSADGVLCYNDELACRLVERAHVHGRGVPDDLSVISIDDSYLAQMTLVPVTSFAHPKEALGRAAAEKLVRLIEEDSRETDFIMQARPVIRASV